MAHADSKPAASALFQHSGIFRRIFFGKAGQIFPGVYRGYNAVSRIA
jgi:hypothetical protein